MKGFTLSSSGTAIQESQYLYQHMTDAPERGSAELRNDCSFPFPFLQQVKCFTLVGMLP